MTITIPVLRHGRSNDFRKHWACAGGVLPESLVYDEIRIDPAPNVVVKDVQFQTCGIHPDEPWLIIWVTVDVPDDSIPALNFQFKRQPVSRTANGSSDISAAMKNTPDLKAVVDEHANRISESVVDAPTN